MKSFLQALFFLIGLISTASAQRVCGTMQYREQLLASNPSLRQAFKDIEKQLTSVKNNNSNIALRDTASEEMIHIPVVIHLLYNNASEDITDAQIKSQIDVLNQDFRMLNADRVNTPQAFKPRAGDAGIQFCLAQVDPQGKRTSGIDRKNTSQISFITDDAMKMAAKGGVAAWDSKRYLNVWVCNLQSNSTGYATPPGGPAEFDGVVIAYNVFGTTGNLRPVFMKGRTATHEIGHWLGLIHTWGDDNCGDDHVDDTPAQQSYNFGCPGFPKLSSCSPDGDGDMFMNFMDFSDDACMNLFTKGQVKRMRALFSKNNFRNSFLSSSACDSTLAQGGALPITGTTPSASLAVSMASAKIYPSPAHNVTTIECKTATALSIKTMNVFNILGVKVLTARLSQEKTTLDLSNLVAGTYIIHISDGKESFTNRIIKQ